MVKKVDPIPAGYHTVTPYIILSEAKRALEFYKKAFNATQVLCFEGENGKVCHAEIKIGDSHIMLADEEADKHAHSPKHYGGSPISLLLYVDDVDTTFKNAIAAGATQVRPVENQFYGDRMGCLTDPFGHTWSIATHVEDVSPEEIHKHAEAAKMKEVQ